MLFLLSACVFRVCIHCLLWNRSVNECICHGIPDARPLQDGDIVNIDISVYYKGFHGDLNETFFVGNVTLFLHCDFVLLLSLWPCVFVCRSMKRARSWWKQHTMQWWKPSNSVRVSLFVCVVVFIVCLFAVSLCVYFCCLNSETWDIVSWIRWSHLQNLSWVRKHTTNEQTHTQNTDMVSCAHIVVMVLVVCSTVPQTFHTMHVCVSVCLSWFVVLFICFMCWNAQQETRRWVRWSRAWYLQSNQWSTWALGR